jgi:hypothetical protein
MSLTIRPACLNADREEMLDLMDRNFGRRPAHHFNWSHIDNPAGKSWSWLAYDSNGNGRRHAVAMVTVSPRHMRVDGRLTLAGQVGSFAVDPSHRSLGPAVMLQRTTFQPVEAGHLAFCYDCPPHDRGMSTFVRLKMKESCSVFRYAFPLRIDDNVEKKLGRGLWTKPITATGNAILRMRRFRPAGEGIEIQQYESLFDDEFDHIDQITASANMVRACRGARDLNYRYRESQDWRQTSCARAFHVLVARRRGEIQGFAVYLVEASAIATVLDIFGPYLDVCGPSLLDGVVAYCRGKNLSSIHAFCSLASGLEPLFQSTGFHRRERSCRVVGYSRQNGTGIVGSHLQWGFTYTEVRL